MKTISLNTVQPSKSDGLRGSLYHTLEAYLTFLLIGAISRETRAHLDREG